MNAARKLALALLIACAALPPGVAASPAGDSQPQKPTELWKRYPLENREQTPQVEASDANPPAADDGSSGGGTSLAWLAIPAALIVAGGVGLALRRRSRRPTPAPATGASAIGWRPAPPRPEPVVSEEPTPPQPEPAATREPAQPEAEPATAEEPAPPQAAPAAAEEPAPPPVEPVATGESAPPEGEPAPVEEPAQPEAEPAAVEESAAPQAELAAAEESAAPEEEPAATEEPAPPQAQPTAAEAPAQPAEPAAAEEPAPAQPAAAEEHAPPQPAPAGRGRGAQAGVPAIGYATVPRAGGIDHPELVAQAQAIARACERHDLALVGLIRDAEPPDGGPVRRPGLTHALRRIASGEADALVVSSLDRLSDSPAGRGRLLEWLDERRARLVVADADLDTGSSAGRLEARALVGVEDGGREEPPEPHHEPSAQAEARRVEPTHTTGGATTVGSRRTETGWTAQEVSELKARIASMRAAGMTLQAIADQLNAERVPTLRGGAQWRPSSVQATTGYKRPRRAGQKRAGPKRDGGEAAGPGGDGSRRGRE